MEYMFSCFFPKSAAEAFGITSLSEEDEAMEPFPHYSTQNVEAVSLSDKKPKTNKKNLASFRQQTVLLFLPSSAKATSFRSTC